MVNNKGEMKVLPLQDQLQRSLQICGSGLWAMQVE